MSCEIVIGNILKSGKPTKRTPSDCRANIIIGIIHTAARILYLHWCANENIALWIIKMFSFNFCRVLLLPCSKSRTHSHYTSLWNGNDFKLCEHCRSLQSSDSAFSEFIVNILETLLETYTHSEMRVLELLYFIIKQSTHYNFFLKKEKAGRGSFMPSRQASRHTAP